MDENTKDKVAEAAEELKAKQEAEKWEEERRKLLATPLSQEEFKKQCAASEIDRLQLQIVRQKWLAQMDELKAQINMLQKNIDDLDGRVIELNMNDAMGFYRTLGSVKTEE